MTTHRRATPRSTRLSLWGHFWLRVGLYGSLGLAGWGHWWHAVRP